MWSWRDAQKCLQNLSGAKNGASRIGWRRLEWRGSGQSTDSAAAFTILKHGSDERERKLYGQLISLQNWEVSTVLKTQIPYISPSRSLYPKEETELCSQNVSQPYSPLWSVILRNQINTFHHCESSLQFHYARESDIADFTYQIVQFFSCQSFCAAKNVSYFTWLSRNVAAITTATLAGARQHRVVIKGS